MKNISYRFNYLLILLLLVGFIMNSCGTLKISNIEKRRYNDGYYVNVSKNKKDKNSSEYKKEDVTSVAPSENKTKHVSRETIAL